MKAKDYHSYFFNKASLPRPRPMLVSFWPASPSSVFLTLCFASEIGSSARIWVSGLFPLLPKARSHLEPLQLSLRPGPADLLARVLKSLHSSRPLGACHLGSSAGFLAIFVNGVCQPDLLACRALYPDVPCSDLRVPSVLSWPFEVQFDIVTFPAIPSPGLFPVDLLLSCLLFSLGRWDLSSTRASSVSFIFVYSGPGSWEWVILCLSCSAFSLKNPCGSWWLGFLTENHPRTLRLSSLKLVSLRFLCARGFYVVGSMKPYPLTGHSGRNITRSHI